MFFRSPKHVHHQLRLHISCNRDFFCVFPHEGGVTNILTTELFTQNSRPAAYMLAGSVNWSSFFFIGLVFPFIVVGVQMVEDL